MHMKRTCVGLLAAFLIAAVAGCKKSEPGQSVPPAPPTRAPSAPVMETVARIHWLGKKRLAAETNAESFMGIWNLPASKKLGTQTLDKLALAPWRLLKGDAATNGAPNALLRPLLDDLVQEESYLEIRGATNQPGELVLAIRLGKGRAGLWETNLNAVLESLTGVRIAAAQGGRRGWSLKKHDAPNLIELSRVGDWTVVGLAQGRNGLLDEMLARIQRDHAPVAASTSNSWVEADFDLRRVATALSLGWNLPADWPGISLTVSSDGQNVLTRGILNFARPLPFELEAWNIPTNLIHDPLVGFTAVRGVSSWLSSLKIWNDLQLGVPPKQAYLWALSGTPLQTYFAAAMSDAAKPFNQITSRLTNEGNAWLAKNGMGTFHQSSNGVTGWIGAPFASPHLETLTAGGVEYLHGGFIPLGTSTNPLPGELIQAVQNSTNLVVYDWEITASRMNGLIYVGQTMRLMLGRPQLPLGSVSLAWLQAAGPKLGNCVTAFSRTRTNQLALVRRSSIGFAAFELHLLADWLESPQFPRGLHTLDAPPDETSIHYDPSTGTRLP